MMHWIYFVVIITVMYVCIATIGRMSGGESASIIESVRQLFTPLLLFLMFFANILFAIGIFYGFIVSSNALPISIAIGIVATFAYSVATLGVTVTGTKLLGVAFVLIGIYFLR